MSATKLVPSDLYRKTGAQQARASQNAYRHGLTLRISGEQFERQLERLARQIAGKTDDKVTLDLARVAAEAHLDLARIRHVKVALIERMGAFGSFEQPKYFTSSWDELRWVIAMMENRDSETSRGRPPRPIAIDHSKTLPPQEPERSAEALRRMLPDLAKLQRYESRAVTRRDRAIQALTCRV